MDFNKRNTSQPPPYTGFSEFNQETEPKKIYKCSMCSKRGHNSRMCNSVLPPTYEEAIASLGTNCKKTKKGKKARKSPTCSMCGILGHTSRSLKCSKNPSNLDLDSSDSSDSDLNFSDSSDSD